MKKTYITLIALFLTCNVFAQLAVFDTTGIAQWPLLTNSYENWLSGAFDANRDTADPFDFGWGTYDLTTHLISGDSIYILKTVGGDYKAISIDGIASGTYTFTYSDLDGSNKKTISQSRAPYGTRNFFQYSFATESFKDLEPATADWDIVFGKYLIYYPGLDMYYPVAGVLSNNGVSVSEVTFPENGSYSLADTVSFPFSDNISTIGYDWKNAGMGGITIHDTVVYFVKDQAGNINELQFTGYGGSATGSMSFKVNGVEDSITLGGGNQNQVYYSLQSKAPVSQSTDNDWDIAFYAQQSFSSIPVRINDVHGAKLFVYPRADISYWNSIGIPEEALSGLITVYPNPATEEINIVLNGNEQHTGEAVLLGPSGRTMARLELTSTGGGISEQRMDVRHLPPGMYILQLKGNGYTATQKIIKN